MRVHQKITVTGASENGACPQNGALDMTQALAQALHVRNVADLCQTKTRSTGNLAHKKVQTPSLQYGGVQYYI